MPNSLAPVLRAVGGFLSGELQWFPWVGWRGHVNTSLTNGVPRPEQSSKNDRIITNMKAPWIWPKAPSPPDMRLKQDATLLAASRRWHHHPSVSPLLCSLRWRPLPGCNYRTKTQRGKEAMGPRGGWDARHRTRGVGLYWLPFDFFQGQAQYVSLTQMFFFLIFI